MLLLGNWGHQKKFFHCLAALKPHLLKQCLESSSLTHVIALIQLGLNHASAYKGLEWRVQAACIQARSQHKEAVSHKSWTVEGLVHVKQAPMSWKDQGRFARSGHRIWIGSSVYKENVDAHEGWRAQTQTHRKGRAPLRTLLFLRKVFLWTTLVQWSLWVKVAQKQSLQVESNTYPRCLQRPGLKHLRFTFLLEACIVPSHNSYSYYW